MKGDFSRDSFDLLHRYSAVFQQQGRVELDADVNERQAIHLRLVRQLAVDLIGPQGGPAGAFALTDRGSDGNPLQLDFGIGPGRYYVDGWLCENPVDVRYAARNTQSGQPGQPWWRPDDDALVAGTRYLVYLDVWERHLCASESDGPAERRSPGAMREVGLGGIDTATRAQVVWQVKTSAGTGLPPLPAAFVAADWQTWMKANWSAWQAQWQPAVRGRLDAKAIDPAAADGSDVCVVSPQSRYRGLENQLYRIEIHRGGAAGDADAPTFVWSRENGSVAFALQRYDGQSAELADAWRDARFDLAVGDIVELSDDGIALGGRAGPLRRIAKVDPDTSALTFDGPASTTLLDMTRHPLLRRWDHGRRSRGTAATTATDGRPTLAADLALTIVEGRWLAIENGLSVRFDATPPDGAARYRSGDYWLIPARTALGDILWRGGFQPPHGVEHHYAPIGLLDVAAGGQVTVDNGPARRFRTLVELSG